MSSLSLAQALVGVFIILFTLFDAFITILSLRGGGPATSFISRKLWRLMLLCHRVKSSHKLLAVSGPVLMVLVVFFWYGALYTGWFLVFNSVAGNILNSTSLTAASALDTWYFIGVTLSGLGYGDFTAQSFPWTIYSTLAVATGTLLTSLGLSYIIAVIPVALEKRQLAHQINALVSDQKALIGYLGDQANVKFMWDKLFSIQLNGTKFSTKYGAYPVVAYFHGSQENSSFSLAYLKASDILFYLANHPNKQLRPPVAAIEAMKNVIRSHTENLRHIIDKADFYETPEQDRYKVLSAIRAAESDSFSWEEFKKLRSTLVMACLYDGW